jgi:hypothetical protein
MTEEPLGPWPLPSDINDLHNEVVTFAINTAVKAAKNYANGGSSPLASQALQRIHRTSITTHRAVRSLCESGWTPVTPVLLRTLLDLTVSVLAIGLKPADVEVMGFRYMTHELIEKMVDPDTEPLHQAGNALQISFLKSCLSPTDDIRARATIVSYYDIKVPPYWYHPEIPNPGSAIRQRMPHLFDLWKAFCGSTHGSDIGSIIFADNPDNAGIGPEKHPFKTRIATVASSRLLLNLTHGRAQCEGVSDDAEYKRIVNDFIKPQEGKIKK